MDQPAQQPFSLISKFFAWLLGTALLVLVFMFSMVALAVIAVGGLLFWAWLWWKTRAIRKQSQEQVPLTKEEKEGRIIEGEAIRQQETSNYHKRLPG